MCKIVPLFLLGSWVFVCIVLLSSWTQVSISIFFQGTAFLYSLVSLRNAETTFQQNWLGTCFKIEVEAAAHTLSCRSVLGWVSLRHPKTTLFFLSLSPLQLPLKRFFVAIAWSAYQGLPTVHKVSDLLKDPPIYITTEPLQPDRGIASLKTPRAYLGHIQFPLLCILENL